jgi:hypothetical protein
MPDKDRQTGQLCGIRISSDREIYGFPDCYVNAAHLWEEIADARKAGDSEYASVRNVLRRDRHCKHWYSYTPGFSPQWHLGEIKMQELELKRQEFERRMADDHKALLLQMETENKRFLAILDKGNKRVLLILGFVLGGIAVLEIIVGLFQVLYPTGFPWLQDFFGIKPPQLPLQPPM